MKFLLFIIAIVFLALLPANAIPITIVNAGFEDIGLSDGQYTLLPSASDGSGIVTSNPVPGWTVTGYAGSWNPPSTVCYDAIPDGVHIIYGHTGTSTFTQTLSATLIANTTYTLQVEVGHRKDVSFVGYQVQFLAGGNLLAQDNNTLFPAANTFLTSTVTFSTQNIHAYLGQALQIKLVSLGAQTNFDKVRLDANTVVPECSSLLLCGLCLAFLFFRSI